MPSFGERLRSEREARGIQLSAVAKATKISEDNLRALESDRFDKLPGSVFNRGFVRACAEFIGLDPDALVAAYESEERAQEERRQEDRAARDAAHAAERIGPGASARAKVKTSRAFVAAAVLTLAGIVALTAWLTRPGTPPPAATSVATPSAPAPPQQPIPGKRAETEPPAEATTEDEIARSVRDEPTPAGLVEPEPAAEGTTEHTTGTSTRDDQASALPAAEPEPGRSPGQPDSASVPPTLSISEHGVGERVVDRRLEGRGTTFEVGERVWFWTRVLGGRPGDRIQHVWLREGTPVSSIEIVIGGPHWRAYTWKTMYPGSGGRWTVEARDAEGTVLATEAFTCVRPGT